MDDLAMVLKEWREAREAFFAAPPVPMEERFPANVWKRLAQAENKLMELARKLD